MQNLLFSIKVVFLSLNLFLFIPYTNYIYKHELNSVDFAKKRTLIIICFLQCMFLILTKKIQVHQHVFPCKAKTHKTKFRAVFYLLDRSHMQKFSNFVQVLSKISKQQAVIFVLSPSITLYSKIKFLISTCTSIVRLSWLKFCSFSQFTELTMNSPEGILAGKIIKPDE